MLVPCLIASVPSMVQIHAIMTSFRRRASRMSLVCNIYGRHVGFEGVYVADIAHCEHELPWSSCLVVEGGRYRGRANMAR
jgi:hypothetical protein